MFYVRLLREGPLRNHCRCGQTALYARSRDSGPAGGEIPPPRTPSGGAKPALSPPPRVPGPAGGEFPPPRPGPASEAAWGAFPGLSRHRLPRRLALPREDLRALLRPPGHEFLDGPVLDGRV